MCPNLTTPVPRSEESVAAADRRRHRDDRREGDRDAHRHGSSACPSQTAFDGGIASV